MQYEKILNFISIHAGQMFEFYPIIQNSANWVRLRRMWSGTRALPDTIREARRLRRIVVDERKSDQIVVATGNGGRRRRGIGPQQLESQKSSGRETKPTRRRSGSAETRTTTFDAAAPQLARTVVAQLLWNTAASHHHCPHLDWQQQLPAAILPANGQQFKKNLLCANAQSFSSTNLSCRNGCVIVCVVAYLDGHCSKTLILEREGFSRTQMESFAQHLKLNDYFGIFQNFKGLFCKIVRTYLSNFKWRKFWVFVYLFYVMIWASWGILVYEYINKLVQSSRKL